MFRSYKGCIRQNVGFVEVKVLYCCLRSRNCSWIWEAEGIEVERVGLGFKRLKVSS